MLLKKDFKKAVELILENKGNIENEIKGYLKTNKNNNNVPIKLTY